MVDLTQNVEVSRDILKELATTDLDKLYFSPIFGYMSKVFHQKYEYLGNNESSENFLIEASHQKVGLFRMPKQKKLSRFNSVYVTLVKEELWDHENSNESSFLFYKDDSDFLRILVLHHSSNILRILIRNTKKEEAILKLRSLFQKEEVNG